MKKLLSMLLALMLLCGCMAFAEEAVDYTGDWTLTGAEMSGDPISVLGLTLTMSLRADGTCTLITGDAAEEGVWAETEGCVAVIDAVGDTNTFVMEDGKLVAEQAGMKIIFTRMDDKAAYVGVWVLTGMESQGVLMGVSTMEMFGMNMTVTLNEDGTCVVAASGVEESGTWAATAQGVAVTESALTIEFAYADDMLVTEAGDSKLMLTREGAAPAVMEAEAVPVLENVPAEKFEGVWELTTANVFGMDLTAEDMDAFIIFELADGKGIYAEGDAEDNVIQLEITYTVTEVEGAGTVLDLLCQDETMTEPAVLLSLNMLEDGRLKCVINLEGLEISYYFTEQVEEVDYTGTWVLTGAEVYGMRLAPQAIGIGMTLLLRDDGTANVAVEEAGEVESTEAIWSVENGTLVINDEDGVEQRASYENGILMVDMQDGCMLFTREGEAPAVAMRDAPVPAANVAAETLEGTWVLTRMTTMNAVEVTPDAMGIQEGFMLENGAGMYAITDDAGEMNPISITYTVTEVEGVGTQIDMEGTATPIMTLYITEDGVMFSDRNGVIKIFEQLAAEDSAAE